MDTLLELNQVVSQRAFLAGFTFVVLLNVALAVATANDVDRLRERRRGTLFFGSVGWFLVVLVSGLIGLAFYWVMHHSNFRDPASDRVLEGR